MIVHLRVAPGLGIAVEIRKHPEISSRPVIMGGLPHQRGAVREANFQAQSQGVRVGMALSQAHQYCPEGIFLQPDLPCYEAVWAEIIAILRRYTPLVEPLELGQVVCDLTGSERRWRHRWHAAYDISSLIRQETGISSWLGVGSNRIVAELASLEVSEDGITVVEDGEERSFLADLPLTLAPEVDARLGLTLQVLGLRTMAHFAALPASAVKQRFGAIGQRLHGYAHGIDPRPVLAPKERPAVTIRRECEEGSIEEALSLLPQMADECAVELRRGQLAGTVIGLTLTWSTATAFSGIPQRPALASRDEKNEPPKQSSQTVVPRGSKKPPLPISYRIHSMLPQPGAEPSHSGDVESLLPEPAHVLPDHVRGEVVADPELCTAVRTVVRTPIRDAPTLLERTRHLLPQSWPRATDRQARLQSLTIEVSEFEQPAQLSFSHLNRLDQTGVLGGMSTVRLRALHQQEQLLATRYGDASFRHLTHVDPSSVLTERSFRWSRGLPWPAEERSRRKS